MIKTLNSILLISCTSIGAGMIALPCLCDKNGIILSIISLITCWFFMTYSSLFIMENSLWFRKKTNIINISNQVIGYNYKLFNSLIYLILLYSLICAYIYAYSCWIFFFLIIFIFIF